MKIKEGEKLPLSEFFYFDNNISKIKKYILEKTI